MAAGPIDASTSATDEHRATGGACVERDARHMFWCCGNKACVVYDATGERRVLPIKVQRISDGTRVRVDAGTNEQDDPNRLSRGRRQLPVLGQQSSSLHDALLDNL